jgi:protein TonB
MNRDFILGLAGSVLLHLGTLFSDHFVKFGGKRPVHPAPSESISLIDPPRYEPEDIERPQEESKEPILTFVPPQQIDIPQVVADSGFTQVVQPPPFDPTRLQSGIPGDFVDARRNARGSNTHIFEPELLDQIPRVRGYRTPPVYPFEMRRGGINGEVLVDFLVDAEGNVLNVRAIASSHRDFEGSAITAVSKWKFHPGRKDGQSVVTHMQVPIMFSLEQK